MLVARRLDYAFVPTWGSTYLHPRSESVLPAA